MTPMDAIWDALEISLLFIGFLFFYVIFMAPDEILSDIGLNTKYFFRKVGNKEDGPK